MTSGFKSLMEALIFDKVNEQLTKMGRSPLVTTNEGIFQSNGELFSPYTNNVRTTLQKYYTALCLDEFEAKLETGLLEQVIRDAYGSFSDHFTPPRSHVESVVRHFIKECSAFTFDEYKGLDGILQEYLVDAFAD